MTDALLTLLDGVGWDGSPVPGVRLQSLLAALVLAHPRAVSVDGLVEAVWPDDEPEHPEKALQVLASRVRSRTAADVVVRRGAGYALGIDPDRADALRLHRLVSAAAAARRAGNLDVAAGSAREALALPVTSTAATGALADVLAGAEDDRRDARQVLGRVLLARGQHREALPLLEAVAAEDPSDEDRLADLLRAEAPVRGVQAALSRYAAHAAGVRDRLGADPGEPLRRLHAELLALDSPVRTGLRHEASPLVGRDPDVTALVGLLDTSRVVTVLGPGGLGKTRMAHLVGALAPHPVVHVVELAGVSTPEGVLPELADALGVRETLAETRRAAGRERPEPDLRARVAAQLSGPPTLLVLDNCEHLVDAVADLVAHLVATVDRLTVLTTSRAPLAIAAERVYPLPQLSEADAVELFTTRARAARPGARLDPAQVAELVRHLDGLPLAIELAAAKVRVMSVPEITRRLDDRFALLTGHDRSAPDRHRTLEAVIAWSWNLLSENDRGALAVLAEFPDGFDLDGAGSLLGRDPVDTLGHLADQSLLVVQEQDSIRYRFLETVREFGHGRLVESGEDTSARERLREWGIGFGRKQSHRVFGREQVEAVRAIRAEQGNLAALLRRAVDAGDAEAAQPLAGALVTMWSVRGEHLTVLGVTEPLLALLSQGPLPEETLRDEQRALLVGLVVNSALFSGQVHREGAARLRALGPGSGGRIAAMVRLVLEAQDEHGRPDFAVVLSMSEDPDPHVRLIASQWASQALENLGDIDAATVAAREALALTDDGDDDPWMRTLLESQLAWLLAQAGDPEGARGPAERAIPVLAALGADTDVAQLRQLLALSAISTGRLDEAETLVGEIGVVDDDGTPGSSVDAATAAGELALARGEVEQGLALWREVVANARLRRFGQTVQFEEDQVFNAPWVLYAEGSCVFIHVARDRAGDAADLVESLRDSVVRLVEAGDRNLDRPVLGCALLGWVAWVLHDDATTSEARDAAVRLVALAHRLGYNQSLPSLAWARVQDVVSRLAGGSDALDRALAQYDGLHGLDLLAEVREQVERVVA